MSSISQVSSDVNRYVQQPLEEKSNATSSFHFSRIEEIVEEIDDLLSVEEKFTTLAENLNRTGKRDFVIKNIRKFSEKEPDFFSGVIEIFCYNWWFYSKGYNRLIIGGPANEEPHEWDPKTFPNSYPHVGDPFKEYLRGERDPNIFLVTGSRTVSFDFRMFKASILQYEVLSILKSNEMSLEQVLSSFPEEIKKTQKIISLVDDLLGFKMIVMCPNNNLKLSDKSSNIRSFLLEKVEEAQKIEASKPIESCVIL